VVERHLLDHTGLNSDEGQGGAVTLIQRFGSAANLNIHLHCLVLDGVYRCDANSAPAAAAASRSHHLPHRLRPPCLAKGSRLQARARPARPMPREDRAQQPLCADIDGFSLHAAVRVEAQPGRGAAPAACLTPGEGRELCERAACKATIASGWSSCAAMSPGRLAGRAGPVARPFARHKQSTGLFESGLSAVR
jgi:hypothetical protein